MNEELSSAHNGYFSLGGRQSAAQGCGYMEFQLRLEDVWFKMAVKLVLLARGQKFSSCGAIHRWRFEWLHNLRTECRAEMAMSLLIYPQNHTP